MPSRPDLRELASNVKEAFADIDRETLLDILTFVLKEYVVEGPPPMLDPPGRDARGSQERVVRADHRRAADALRSPRAAMFAVDGDQVSVRVGGVMQPLIAGRAGCRRRPSCRAPPRACASSRRRCSSARRRPPPRPPPPPPQQQGRRRRRRAACRCAAVRRETRRRRRRPPRPQPAARGRRAAAAAPRSRPPTKPADKPEAGGDDASARFSLLELD